LPSLPLTVGITVGTHAQTALLFLVASMFLAALCCRMIQHPGYVINCLACRVCAICQHPKILPPAASNASNASTKHLIQGSTAGGADSHLQRFSVLALSCVPDAMLRYECALQGHHTKESRRRMAACHSAVLAKPGVECVM
jgi:hypothetical protein